MSGFGNFPAIGSAACPQVFVDNFRSAAPYVGLHKESTFVIVLPGEVVQDQDIIVSIVDDIAMLHGMGVKLVLVLGAQPSIDKYLRQRGKEPEFQLGFRVTDEVSMEAAMDAAGSNRVLMEALLSKGPSVPMVRRHARTDAEFHYSAAINVVSGNYVAARRRGVMGGIDYGYTGTVRFIHADAIQSQLANKNIVLLSNLGYSVAGELLNCSTFDVGVRAAVELKADKLICVHLDEVARLRLPEWLSLTSAAALLRSMDPNFGSGKPHFVDWTGGKTEVSECSDPSSLHGSVDSNPDALHPALTKGTIGEENAYDAQVTDSSLCQAWKSDPVPPVVPHIPVAVLAAYEACQKGVKRAHLVNAQVDGGLLLELYTRDGVGTMISTDFYEGIRRANIVDLPAVQDLLAPLELDGVVVPRSQSQLYEEIESFVVIERETRVLACTQLRPLGPSRNGEFQNVAEIAAFCVHPDSRGTGRGDSLLDWTEQEARCSGFDLIVLLTTRTADWFQARDFVASGPAHLSDVLPLERRKRIDPKRNSQLYVKQLLAPTPGMLPGSRIGV